MVIRLEGVVKTIAIERRCILGDVGDDSLMEGGLADNAGADALTGGDDNGAGGDPAWRLAA